MATIDTKYSVFNQISNDISRIRDDNDDEFKFEYGYVKCNNEDAIWGNGNKPQIQNNRIDTETYNLPYLSHECNSCHTIWNNSTSRKLIVKDY